MHQPPTQETIKGTVLRLYNECFNQGKLEIADRLVSPSFTGFGPDGSSGPDAFKSNVAQLRSAFPDLHFTVHEIICENNRLALYWTWEGTQRGIFINIPPTGKRVHQEGMVFYRFNAGQVVEAKAVFDRLGVLQQLGVPPLVNSAQSEPRS